MRFYCAKYYMAKFSIYLSKNYGSPKNMKASSVKFENRDIGDIIGMCIFFLDNYFKKTSKREWIDTLANVNSISMHCKFQVVSANQRPLAFFEIYTSNIKQLISIVSKSFLNLTGIPNNKNWKTFMPHEILHEHQKHKYRESNQKTV